MQDRGSLRTRVGNHRARGCKRLAENILTALADRTTVVGLIGGVDTVRCRAVGDGAVHFPVWLAATALTAR